MNRLIPVICFTLLFGTFAAQARVVPIGRLGQIPKTQQQSEKRPQVRVIDEADFEKIVAEGFSHAPKADPKGVGVNMNIVKTSKKNEPDKDKSVFEKIYDKALKRIESTSVKPQRNDVMVSDNFKNVQSIEEQKKKWYNENIPVIKTELPPDNVMTPIVAMEHIPYLMNSIEILPSGIVKFEETVVVVANGEKLRHGLTKILPLNVYNNKGKRHRIDYSIIGVKINGSEQDYYLSSNDEQVYILPKNDYDLDSGVYTYKFEYVADNLLWREGDSYNFFWDVGGNGWNLVVDRLGASLNMPLKAWKESRVLLGSPSFLSSTDVEIRRNGPTALAYIAKRPLFIGEGMYLISSINADALMPETLWQKLIRCFYDWYDVILAFVGWVIVIISFIVSWRFILKNKGQLKLSLNKTALIIRYFMFDKFDIKSMCGFLLEAYKKNIIDIQQTNDAILLIKKTDHTNSLTSNEKKALNCLFPKHETIFNVSPKNNLPFKRFAKFLRKSLQRQITKFQVKLIGGYFVMGLAMMLTIEAIIAVFGYRFLYNFSVMALATLVGSIGIMLVLIKSRWWIKMVACLLAIDIWFLSLVLFSAVIHPLAGVFLVLTLISISVALVKYSKKNGLLRHYIDDMENFKNYLRKHHDTIILGKDFQTYQPAIWAMDLEEDFKFDSPKEYNKLPIMSNVVKAF